MYVFLFNADYKPVAPTHVDVGLNDTDEQIYLSEELHPLPNQPNLGPLCTHLCHQYGHSDACWMHVASEYILT